MSVQEAAPVIGMKESLSIHQDVEHFLDFTIGNALPSRLASLTLVPPVGSMATPPALATPPPLSGAEPPLDFTVRVAGAADEERLLAFLRRTFFLDEPLNVAVNLLEGGGRCKELEEYSVSSLGDRLSFVAESGGDLVGVLMGGSETREEAEAAYENNTGEDCDHPRLRKILTFLGECERQARLFDKYPDLESCFDLKIIAVDPAWRGRGVAGRLTRAAVSAAKLANIGFMKVACSSHFSAKIAERLGCVESYNIPYSEYKIDGKPVFSPQPPHTTFVMKTQRLRLL